MGPIASIISSLRFLFRIDTRAQRSEFWWTALVLLVVLIGGVAANFELFERLDPIGTLRDVFSAAFVLFYVAVLGCYFSITIRRLHDVNLSGWNCLCFFIPGGIGILVLVVMCSRKGTIGFNDFGPDFRQSQELEARMTYDEADEFG